MRRGLWIACAGLAMIAPAAARAQAQTPPPGAFCAANPPIRATPSDWTSVGGDVRSTRFQRNPGLTAAQVPRLKLKWAFAMTGGGAMPAVVGEWLFATNTSGRLYALDARTGCIRWMKDGVVSRTTPIVTRSAASPSGWLLITGERNRTVRAFDAQTGAGVWKSARVEAHPLGQITGAPALADGRLYVPMSSQEFNAAQAPGYPCCSFRGSLSVMDAATGAIGWQTYAIPEPLRLTHPNAAGTPLQGPAGAAIWGTPTVDAARGLVYVGTGNSYTDAPTVGADAIVAIELATGAVRWRHQATRNDNFISGCWLAVKPVNCPAPHGPDHDFGASPILFRLGDGKDVLLAGQKSGVVFGLDPGAGATLWSTRVGAGSEMGGVHWGMAADDRRLYVAISDLVNLVDEVLRPQGLATHAEPMATGEPGLTALDPATGKVLWHAPAPAAPCRYAGDRSRDAAKGACIRAQSAAPSVMPGAVFEGGTDGWLRAYDSATGKVLWAYSTTAQTYDTVNGVKGQPGGSLDAMGTTIAGGMVFAVSGYNGANTGGNPVNVLLAFSVDGR